MDEIRMPQPGEGWRHYKGGYLSLYEIVGMGRDTETGQPVVIYKPFGCAPFAHPPLYSRPLGVFLGSVDTPDGHVQRFVLERPKEQKGE